VILLLIIFFMRKRVALTIALFHVAGKVFLHLPLLVVQPFWTFLCLLLFWVYWLSVFLFLGISGTLAASQVRTYLVDKVGGDDEPSQAIGGGGRRRSRL